MLGLDSGRLSAGNSRSALFHQLVVYLSRQYSLVSEKSINRIHLFAKAVSYIETEYLSPLNLSVCGVSARQFTRMFKTQFGTTPINYVLNLRLMHGARLLLETDTPVIDIAFASGFCDSNYFTRQFKKNLNISPRDYRRQRKIRYMASTCACRPSSRLSALPMN